MTKKECPKKRKLFEKSSSCSKFLELSWFHVVLKNFFTTFKINLNAIITKI